MRPINIELCAFGPFADFQNLDFTDLGDERLFLITGPTGAGKSSIFEAMFFALFGYLSKDGFDQKQLRSDFAKNEALLTFVRFRFMIGNKVYEIYRQPAQKVAKKRGHGYKDEGQLVTLTALFEGGFAPLSKIEEVNAKVQELIGLDGEQFKKIIMLPQGEFRRFLSAGTKEKTSILRHLFGTGRYQRIRDELALRVRQLKEQVEKDKVRQESVLQQWQWPLGQDQSKFDPQSLQAVDERRLANLADNIETCQSVVEQHNQLIGEARLINEKRNRLELLQVEEESHRQQLMAVEEKRNLLHEIKLAQPLHLKEVRLKEESKKLETLEQSIFVLKQEIASFKEDERQGKLLLHGYQAESKEMVAKKNQVTYLSTTIETYKRWQEQQGLTKASKGKVEQAKERCKRAVELQIRLGNELDQDEIFLADLQEIAPQVVKLEHEIAKLVEEKNTLIKRWQELNAMIQKEQQVYEAEQKLAKAKRLLDLATQDYNVFQKKVFNDYAAVLAQGIKSGSPCPVCGAIEHPKLAMRVNEQINEQTLKIKEVRVNKLTGLFSECMQMASRSRGVFENERKTLMAYLPKHQQALAESQWQVVVEVVVAEGKEIKERLGELQTTFKECEQKLMKQSTLKAEHAQRRRALDESITDLNGGEVVLRNAEIAYSANCATEELLRSQLPDQIMDLTEIKRQILNLEKEMSDYELKLTQQEEKVKQASIALAQNEGLLKERISHYVQLDGQVKQLTQDFQNQCNDVFRDEHTYRRAVENMAEQAILDEAIKAYDLKTQRLRLNLMELQTDLKGMPEYDLPQMESLHAEYGVKLQSYIVANTEIHERYRTNQSLVNQLAVLNDRLQELGHTYQTLGTLFKLVSGDNQERMDLETFVLIYYFEKVIFLANRRLQKMSEGRFLLVRHQGVVDKRSQGGLELDVLDHFTGRTRPVATLSGGESFKASLSLALGLADVVSEESGGIVMDSVFIDEGFGTLDEESLDKTLDALFELQSGGRLVGIISHVPELKERIGARLLVQRSENGSKAGFEVNYL